MKNNYIKTAFLTSILLCVSGCAGFIPFTGDQGIIHTPASDIINMMAETAKSVGLFFPIAGAVGGLLSLIANGILGYVTKKKTTTNNKLTNALESVVAGVNEASANYDAFKKELVNIAKTANNQKLADDIEKAFNDNLRVKDFIQAIAQNKNIEDFLRFFVKNAEAKGIA